MKRLLFIVIVGLASTLVAADRSVKGNAGIGEANNAADPAAPYDGYTAGMATEPGDPNAVEFQESRRALIAGMTEEAVLASFVADRAAADGLLLNGLRGAYATDPLVATQIAAVTQYVMGPEPAWYLFWKPSPAAGRRIWVDALKFRMRTATDEYVRIFCADQLRWCDYQDENQSAKSAK